GVLNGQVYLDGGIVSEKGVSNAWPVKNTLSLDLTTPWLPQEASFRSSDKSSNNIPSLWKHAMFVDNAAGAFYIWGGRYFFISDPPPLKFWKFTANKNGGGSWATEEADPSFNAIIRSEAGAFTSSKDAGFWFGGQGTPETHDGLSKLNIPGFVSFNFTTKIWTNHTDAPFSPRGTLVYATATYLPGVGPNGIIMLLGGQGVTVPKGSEEISLETVHFLDPVTLKWYKQKTTGQVPTPRIGHCAVGVTGSNSSEIFVYGGASEGNKNSDVYILSLPGFNWVNTGATSEQSRIEMGCVAAGNRNMIVVGGAKFSGNDSTTDMNSQGLGIFDMTALEWKTKYTPDAGQYETPEVVTKWYRAGNLAKVAFSEGVKDLFSEKETGSNNTSSEPDQDKTMPLSAGAIAGAVVGGVAGIAAIAALLFFLLRKKKHSPRSQHSQMEYSPAYDQSPYSSTMAKYPPELINDGERFELSAPRRFVELPTQPQNSP
ncbi:unnamed protein product, partial [Clonostachys byssicola]